MIAGYRAHPSSPSGPGVLVLHEAWGLTEDIRRAADRIAEAGFVAFAPDMRARGSVASGLRGLWRGGGSWVELAERSVDALLAEPAVDHESIGVVGFSMGAAVALLLDRHPAVAVIVANYGLTPRGALAARGVPVVAHFAGNDRVLMRPGSALRRRASAAGSPLDFEVYEKAGHSFMTDVDQRRARSFAGRFFRIGHHAESAARAWQRTIAALDGALRTPCGRDGSSVMARTTKTIETGPDRGRRS